jgi:hypothetical protein
LQQSDFWGWQRREKVFFEGRVHSAGKGHEDVAGCNWWEERWVMWKGGMRHVGERRMSKAVLAEPIIKADWERTS